MRLLVVLLAAGSLSQAQEARPTSLYRVELQLRETGGSAPAASRRFTMLIQPDTHGRLNSGKRIPAPSGGSGWQYVDVGVNLRTRLHQRDGQLQISVDAQISDVAAQPALPNAGPAIVQHHVQSESIVQPGKPTLLLTWEEPQGARRYEVEATVTPVP